MPLFRRSSTHSALPSCPRCATQDALQNTVQSIQATLRQHRKAGHLPQIASEPPQQARSGVNQAALCTLGLVAVAGLALYATRNPRIPQGIHPVEDFELQRYLGKWYEVARIDHSFEKGLQRTQAEYSLLPNGRIQVVNRGYDPKRGEWKISFGKAMPTIRPDVAALKVSFFGPFYGGYNVVALDDKYRWAMVIGDKLDYFWILSRTPTLPDGVQERLLHHAQQLGVDLTKVLWVHQDGVNPTGSYL